MTKFKKKRNVGCVRLNIHISVPVRLESQTSLLAKAWECKLLNLRLGTGQVDRVGILRLGVVAI